MLQQLSLSTFARYALSTVFVAALSACGGGSTDAGSSAAAATDGDGTASALKVRATAVADTTSTTTTASAASQTTQIAVEGGSFTVTGTQTVRFGAGSSWISTSVTGSGQCSNTFFGNDPAFGTFKSCQLVTAAATTGPVNVAPTALATEGGSFTVSGTQTVQFGAGASWVSMSVTGTGLCTNAFFGKDPAFGIVKSCRIASTATAAASVLTTTAWVQINKDGDKLSVPDGTTVRYGDGFHWVTKTIVGGGSCAVSTFGSDPAPWVPKTCENQVTVPAVTQTGTAPVINTGLIPGASTAFTGPQVRQLTATELASPVFTPNLSDSGAFREPCMFSHMNFDDPIAYPGQPGKSHLHVFMGNSAADASSTGDSMVSTGGSTCTGGTLNRSGYWQPAMVDIRTGQPIVPRDGSMYYKVSYFNVPAASIRAFPKGLRMIAGDASLTTNAGGMAHFACMTNGSWQNTIPNCALGDTLMANVTFPQCWDGINLDSPDHKSHMAYGVAGQGCPSDHPVALPEISIRFDYMVTDANTSTNWRLSSDNYAGPGGYSLHADWYNGWDAATNQEFVTNCLNASMDCHDYLLGDGRILY